MTQELVKIPGDWEISDRAIVRSMFSGDVYDYPGEMLNLAQVHQKYTGKGINIGVLDTGYMAGHPDLDDDVFKECFTDNRMDSSDWQGHGTHVRGIINMQKNGKGLIGIAPGAKVHIGKVLQRGFGRVEWVAKGIDWCVEMGFDIIVGSLGTSISSKVISEAVERAAGAGILMFFASGNEGSSKVLYPAALPDGIAIGAVDAAKLLADFSNVGTALDMVAPGVGIKSTWIDGNYRESSGTSMATPIAAGVAALYLEAARMGEPDVRPFKIRDKLYVSSEDLGDTGLDIKYGYGLVSTKGIRPQPLTEEERNEIMKRLRERFSDDSLAPVRGCMFGLVITLVIWTALTLLII